MQDRFERYLFHSATVHELKKVCEICSVGNLYQFLCLCFGLGLAQRIFSKLLKVPIALLRRLNIRLMVCLDDILLMGRTLEEILTSRDTLIFLFKHLSFCHKSEKISSETTATNRYPRHEFGTNRGKDRKGNFKMPESPFSPSNHCFGVNQIDRSDELNCPSCSACPSTAKLFTTTTTTITKPSLFIPGRDSLSKHELFWCVENLTFNNGRSLRQKEPNSMKQTDASKSSWRAFCNGVSTWGKWSEKEENLNINVLELITATENTNTTENSCTSAHPYGVTFSTNRLQCLQSTFPVL